MHVMYPWPPSSQRMCIVRVHLDPFVRQKNCGAGTLKHGAFEFERERPKREGGRSAMECRFGENPARCTVGLSRICQRNLDILRNFFAQSFPIFCFHFATSSIFCLSFALASLHFMVSSIALPVTCSCALCECLNSYLILVPIYHKLS